MLDLNAALPTFVITLREGVEAALVVGIVLTYVTKAQRSALSRWVYWGVAAGIVASILVGAGLTWFLQGLDASAQPVMAVLKPLIEATIGVVAIVLLSWMLIWMTEQGKTMKAEVEGSLSAVLTTDPRAGWSLFTLVLAAVLREGFETVLFLATQFQQGWMPILGSIAGLCTAAIVGVLLFRFGVRLNIRRFFQVMGVLLLLIVAGLVIGVLHQVDATLLALARQDSPLVTFCSNVATTCMLGPPVWDGSQVLPDRQFPGVLLKALLGYRQHLYLVQVVGYLTFLLTVGSLYVQSLTGRRITAFHRVSQQAISQQVK